MIQHIYIHIPFCLSKCGYCSFYSENYSADKTSNFLTRLIEEIRSKKQEFDLQPKTLYFGGGTPSILDVKQIESIISEFDISRTDEITLECNPYNLNKEFAEGLQRSAVDRISLGAQSFLDKELKLLGRLHDTNQIELSFKLLRSAGFRNISVDLIYGLPEQKKDDLQYSLDNILKLNPEHVSTYCLSLDNDVPLYKKRSQIPSDETVSKFYYLILKKLQSNDYQQYEISNFSKDKFVSKHNLAYWNDKYFIGFGPSAASYFSKNNKVYRKTNLSELKNWWNGEYKELSKSEMEKEFIFLELRKTKGLDLQKYSKKFNKNFINEYRNILNKFENFLIFSNDSIKLSPEAYFVSDEIFKEFM